MKQTTNQIGYALLALQCFKANELDKTISSGAKIISLYAKELLENFLERAQYSLCNENTELYISEKELLNGAADWYEFSNGGNSLISDEDICNRLKMDSFFNTEALKQESALLTVQAFILERACNITLKTIESIKSKINEQEEAQNEGGSL